MRASDITLESLFNNGPSRVVSCSLQGGGDDSDLYLEISIIYFREFRVFKKSGPGPGPIAPPGAAGPLKVLGPWGSGGLRAQRLPGTPGPPKGREFPGAMGPGPGPIIQGGPGSSGVLGTRRSVRVPQGLSPSPPGGPAPLGSGGGSRSWGSQDPRELLISKKEN